MPREIDRRLGEFQATTKVSPNQLLLLGLHVANLAEEAGWDAATVNEIRGAAHEMIRRPGMPRLESLRNAIKPLKERWMNRGEGNEPLSASPPTAIPFPRVAPDGAAPRSWDDITSRNGGDGAKDALTPGTTRSGENGAKHLLIKKRVQSGSTDAPMVSDDLARRIATDFRQLVNNNWDEKLAGAGRRKIIKEDVAVEVAIYRHVAEHRNPDNSVPVAWFKVLWDDLKDRGYTSRAFDPSRYAAIRDYMTTKRWLKWEDRGYTIGREIDGVFVKGQATRHGASDYLIGYGEEGSGSGIESEKVGGGEEREDIVRNKIPTSSPSWIIDLSRESRRGVKRPECRGYVG